MNSYLLYFSESISLSLKKWKSILAFGLIFMSLLSHAAQQPGAFKEAKRYDLNGRVVGVIRPAGNQGYPAERREYSDRGLLVAIEYGRLAAWQDESVSPSNWQGFSQSHQKLYTYDEFGRKHSEGLAQNGARETLTEYSYDNHGRVECVAKRMNSMQVNPGASACDQLGSSTSEFGSDRIEKYVYDNLDNVLEKHRGVGTGLHQRYATYTYDGLFRKSAKDANNYLTEYDYDNSGRLSHTFFPDKVVAGSASSTDYERYDYDHVGNKIQVRKRDGTIIDYTYDALNQVSTKKVEGNSSLNVCYRYNLMGHKTSIRRDSNSSCNGPGIFYAYSGFGQVTSETTNYGNNWAYTLRYGYDKNGNRESITYPDGRSFDYQYDSQDRIFRIRQGSVTLITYQSDDFARPKAMTTSGGATTSIEYDNVSRVDEINNQFDGSAHDLGIEFDYNPANQIVRKNLSNGRYHHSGRSAQTGSYQVNGLNQYIEIDGETASYDDNGNFTSDGTTTYRYDAENRLTNATGAYNARLEYDPLGRLIRVRQHDSGMTTPTYFLYSGDDLVAEYQDGEMTRRYIHSPGGALAPVVRYEGSQTWASRRHFLHTNHQGSVIASSNSSGEVTQINTYDEFGAPGAGNEGRFSYTGQLYLPELGLYHYRARAYNPYLGRFLQTDPIGYEDQMNLYAYVHNDPLNYTDPTGNQAYQELGVYLGYLWETKSHDEAVAMMRETTMKVSSGAASTLEITRLGPAMDGFELAQKIRSGEDTTSKLIGIATGQISESVSERALRKALGASGAEAVSNIIGKSVGDVTDQAVDSESGGADSKSSGDGNGARGRAGIFGGMIVCDGDTVVCH